MSNNYFRMAVFLITLLLSLPAYSLIYIGSFSSELSRTDILPPFGSYVDDVTIRKGSIVTGTFRYDTGLGQFLEAPIIHLRNFKYYNNDDVTPLHEQLEGVFATPTDWVFSADESSIGFDSLGQLHFNIKAWHGPDISQNRPFYMAGDLGGSHYLNWLLIGNDMARWNIGQERLSPVEYSLSTVSPVPEPGSMLLIICGLFVIGISHFRSFKNPDRLSAC